MAAPHSTAGPSDGRMINVYIVIVLLGAVFAMMLRSHGEAPR
jgi:hypothetical protein